MENKDFILILLIFISSIFFSFANFYNKLAEKKSIAFIVLMSVLFASCEYIVKIPAIFYFGKDRSSVFIYCLMLVATFTSTLLFSRFVLRENVHNFTYFILLTIISLLFINEYVISNKYVA
jgi:uncharacterized protein (DUF486 family)